MDALKAIRTRRSIRQFTDKPITIRQITTILEAARWAPSGLNNQPWRFVVIQDQSRKEALAKCTRYSSIVQKAPLLICVLLDRNATYNRLKDLQAIGACIQNMLLAAHAIKLGACWLGEILHKRRSVERILHVHKKLELMAVLAIGYPKKKKQKRSRLPLKKIVLPVFFIILFIGGF
ncbi:MAG: nitroreductase family protein [Elusimicrobia bacterium]|nr:nitroreductase family protein [Elusimicrobiota bacterium]MBD3411952.1 nitroreductase family protein [Elusimicrobiota bacterium]